ncbi:RHS repeat-associated protein [Paenibacillus mucilaginosus]|uniref:RHS repeat-associated core domain-containing protein n=1 Tax=Paenibacillus mucilaginosus TaxID=61624 RepID=UPI003D209939
MKQTYQKFMAALLISSLLMTSGAGSFAYADPAQAEGQEAVEVPSKKQQWLETYQVSEEETQEALDKGFTSEEIDGALQKGLNGKKLADVLTAETPVEVNVSGTAQSVVENELTVPENQQAQTQSVSAQETTQPANYSYVNTHPDEAPYSVSLDAETISTLSGSLSVKQTDMVLPGRGGVSLALTRTYSSADAQFYDMDIIDYSNGTKKQYLESLYPIGKGWGWDLSSVQTANGEHYLHMSGGGVYQVNPYGSLISLKGYPWQDLTFEKAAVTVGAETSANVLKSVHGSREYFGADGRLLRITDTYESNKIDFLYTTHPVYGKVLSSITDSIGNTINITYSETEVVLTKGNEVVTYRKVKSYNGIELLSQVEDQMGRKTTYDYKLADARFHLYALDPTAYNPYALLRGITHPTGAKTEYVYESSPITRLTGNESVNQAYRILSREDQVVLSNGTKQISNRKDITYSGDMGSSYDTDLFFEASVNDGKSVTTYQNEKDAIPGDDDVYYTPKVTSTAGNIRTVTENEFDRTRRYTSPKTTTVKTVRVDTGEESAAMKTSRTYDSYGNVLTSTDPMNVTTIYTYKSPLYLLESETRRITDSQSRYTEYGRNDKGIVTQVSIKEGGAAGNIVQQINYEIDDYGNARKTSIKDTNRTVVVDTEYGEGYQYAFPTKQSINVTDIDGAVSAVVKDYAYDKGTGKLTQYTDGRRSVTKYEYDKLGRVTKKTNPDNSTVQVAYDDKNNQIQYTDETGVQTVTKWNPLGQKVETGTREYSWYKAKDKFGYDAYGRLQWIEDALANRTTYSYDAWDRQMEVRYPDGGIARMDYDDVAKTLTKTDPENVYPVKETQDIMGRTTKVEAAGKVMGSSVYDYAGQIREATDAMNGVSKYEYSATGKLTAVTNAKLEKTSYSYDMMGNLTTTTYPDGKIKEKWYDELSRVIQSKDANGKVEKYYYDANNNVTKMIDRNGEVTEQKYEQGGRDFLTSSTAPGDTVTFAYDTAGRRTRMTSNGTDITKYGYNPATGELVSVTYPDGKAIQYDYDAAGNRRGMVDPFGGTTYYTYDGKNRLKTVGAVSQGLDPDITYSYNKNDLLVESVQKNKVKSVYTYDRLRLDTLVQTSGNGAVVGSYDYGYDDNDNQVSRVENGVSQSYAYDKLNRIEKTSENGQTLQSYEYDSRGNRTRFQTVSMAETKDYKYTFDKRDRLTNVMLQNGKNVAYKYNGDGLLWERTEDEKTTRYYYDGDQLIAEGEVNGSAVTLKARYVRGSGKELIAREDSDSKAYYLHNGHGDVTELRDSTGARLNSYQYDIWGNSERVQETVSNPFRYSGEYWDNTTNLQNLRARWYDPSIGRFISEDTNEGDITNPLSLNLYTYAHNNPILWIDPSGHEVTMADKQAQRQGIISDEDIRFIEAATKSYENTEYNAVKNWIRRSVVEIRIEYDEFYVDDYDYTYGGTYDEESDPIARAIEETSGGFSLSGRAQANSALREALGMVVGGVTVHGNSRNNTRDHHGYEIYEVATGDVVKTGISGGALKDDGTSRRAGYQVRKLNDAEGSGKYAQRVVATGMKGRQAALAWEIKNTKLLKQAGNSMTKHKRPK